MALFISACGGSSSSTSPTTSAPRGTTTTTTPGTVRFAVWGDTPYSDAEKALIPPLVQGINAAGVDLTVNVGDLGSSDACSDETYASAASTFDAFDAPLVYVPGDNEWTDCHRSNYDPLERLSHLRQVMFSSAESFGHAKIPLVQQSPDRPEHTRWQQSSVVFVGLNVAGSNNNHIPDPSAAGARPTEALRAAEAEYEQRDAAVRDWLHSSFEEATAVKASGIVIVLQADPGFEVATADRAGEAVDGFDQLLVALVTESKAFAKPVVIVHGDSHRYRLDNPLKDPATGQTLQNVTRVETYGSPFVGWVEVTLQPNASPFVAAQGHRVTGARP